MSVTDEEGGSAVAKQHERMIQTSKISSDVEDALTFYMNNAADQKRH